MKKLLGIILPRSLFNALRRFKRFILRYINLVRVKTNIFLHRPLKNSLNKIQFEINLVEHCNLNCRSCSNFSCIAEPEFVDIEEFKRDLTRMGEIFNHDCERIYLIGGEPLLHPEVITLMKIAREQFTTGKIYIFTNGILLTKMSDDFWQACRDNNMIIYVSAYPIKLDYDKIIDTAKRFGVTFQWAWNSSKNHHDLFSIVPINLAGDSDINLQFGMCHRALHCITLKKGKLFTCSFAPHVHHFNKKFGKNIEITDADYINIYDNVTADEILTRLSKPIPACRYCIKDKPEKIIQWGHSEGKIEEWM